MAVEQQLEGLALQRQGLVQRQVGAGQDNFLDLRQRQRRQAGDLASQFEGAIQCLAIRRHLADQPYGQGLRRPYRATGKQHAQRLELAHRSHQALGAAGAGHHADTNFRLGEARRGTGDDQVAVHRQLAASAQGMALHGGDQRLAAGGERLPVALHPALLDLQHGRLRQFVEIGAGGERRAISGEDDDPGIGALVEAPYVLRQSLAQAHVQGVEHCRAVQSQQGHALLRPLQQHEFGAHRPRGGIHGHLQLPGD